MFISQPHTIGTLSSLLKMSHQIRIALNSLHYNKFCITGLKFKTINYLINLIRMHDMGCIYRLLVLNGARIQNDEWRSPILISQ